MVCVLQVYQVPCDLPRDISSLEFPFNNLVENIQHEPMVVQESSRACPELYSPGIYRDFRPHGYL